jgi:hypothetical protein
MLQQNACHIGVAIQRLNLIEKLLRRGLSRQGDLPRPHAHAFARVAFHAHIRRRGGVFTN